MALSARARCFIEDFRLSEPTNPDWQTGCDVVENPVQAELFASGMRIPVTCQPGIPGSSAFLVLRDRESPSEPIDNSCYSPAQSE